MLIPRKMERKKWSNNDLSNLRLYANEFAELVKNNREPMTNKLLDECVYNMEPLYFL